MDFKFQEVKNLFDKYSLKVIDGKWAVTDRKTSIPCFDEQFIAEVKFAHTWVKATEYNRSRTTTERQIVTPDDYQYAFNENAKAVYDSIMAYSQQVMQAAGTLYRPEVLKQEVEGAVKYKYAGSIVDGIYQEERYAKSFEDWVRYSTKIPELYPQKNEHQSFGSR